LPFDELLENVSRFDRVLTAPGGSLLLCGRSGVGRRTALAISSSMNNMKIFSPKINRSYGIKQFKNDLKMIKILNFAKILLIIYFKFTLFDSVSISAHLALSFALCIL